MRQNSFKILIRLLLITSSLILYSCLNEDTLDKVENNYKIKVGLIKIENARHLEPRVQNFESKLKNKRTFEYQNLDLDLNNILKYSNLETGYNSYSIVIKNTMLENEGYHFENLHFTEYSDQVFDEYICRWIPNNPNEKFKLSTFTGVLEKYDLDYNLQTRDELINGVIQIKTNRSNLKNGNGYETTEYPIDCILVIDCTPTQCDCYDDSTPCSFWYHCSGGGGGSGDGGSGDGGFGDGTGEGGGGGGNGSGNTGNENDNGYIGENGDPLHPIIPLDPSELEIENIIIDNPCDKIKNSTSTNNSYKTKLKSLNQQSNYNLTHETGFGQVGNNYIDGVALGNHTVRYPNNSKNGTHVHNNNPNFYPNTTISYDKNIKILSPADIINGLIPMQDNNLDPKDTFVIMASNEGLFAITILEPLILDASLELKLKEFEKYYLKKVQYIVDNFINTTPISRKKYLEKIFLLGLKEYNLDNNIGLFEGEIENENATNINDYKINWTKKTLKKVFLGYKVNPTPCN